MGKRCRAKLQGKTAEQQCGFFVGFCADYKWGFVHGFCVVLYRSLWGFEFFAGFSVGFSLGFSVGFCVDFMQAFWGILCRIFEGFL